MKAYLANGLFSEADQAFNDYLAHRLRNEFSWMDLYVPQENEALNDKQGYADSVAIYNGDNQYLDEANILIAVLDGVEIDAGVATEIGRFTMHKELYPHGNPRYVFGLYTDVRQNGTENEQKISALVQDGTENQFMYRNLYTLGAIKLNGIIVPSSDHLIREIKRVVERDDSVNIKEPSESNPRYEQLKLF